ncbi:MAG: YihY family inner membrane protein, partial [Pseudomonadales bacterium]|nr:YihY family inner membrane protein [Pseudomonadales bacterium]
MAALPKDNISKFIDSIWHTELSSMPRWRANLTQCFRVLFAVARDMTAGQLTLRAMSLVYTTLLSLVPLLAVSFSVLKAFGVHNQIEPLLLNLLAPLGDQGVQITTSIIGFVENMKVGVLGSLGVALLFYTVIALMQKIEAAFNHTWRVSHTRPMSQRFSDYLSVLMIGPVLVISALGLTSTMLNTSVVQWIAAIEPFGSFIEAATKLIPYILIICAFIFIYTFIPNTKVKLKPAFVGALVAGVLWQTAGWGFATFVATSAKTAAIYSAFATLIFFLIWLHVG